MEKKFKELGFTLIEIMVAIIIFSIIATVSYRVIASLVKTKQIVDETQNKWGSISLVSSNLSQAVHRLIPLAVRDNNGNVLPAVYGKNKLTGVYDGQLEMTLSGSIGDEVTGVKPPKRIGYRFYNGSIYLITWPVLNRAQNSTPEIDLLVDNVDSFSVDFMYNDGKWYDSWPPETADMSSLPLALKVSLLMKSGESIEREWSITK